MHCAGVAGNRDPPLESIGSHGISPKAGIALTSSFHYSDTDDRITACFIGQAEPYAGYWAASEQRAFRLALGRLQEVLGPRSGVHALDAGCGDGRLLPWLEQVAGHIKAVDPDASRLATARYRAAELHTVSTPQLEISSITDLAGGPFDLVVCSHVIQHVPTGELVPLLRRLYQLTKRGGTLLLAYSRAPVGREGFSVDRIEDGEIRSLHLTREQFDSAFSGDGLPIRYFDPVDLARQAHEIGWEESWTWAYHVLDNLGVLDSYINRDELVNNLRPLWQQLGRDMLALWHRRNQ